MNLTVPEVLAEVGWPPGRYCRTACPVHQGKNATSFSYTDEVWSCHACGAGGNAYQLAIQLGIRKPPRHRLEPGAPLLKGVSRRLLERTHSTGTLAPTEWLWRGVRGLAAARMAIPEACLEEAEDWVSLGADLYRVAPHRIDVRDVAMETVCLGLEIEARYRGRYERDQRFVEWIQERRYR